jgi:hypothetical protein
MAKMTALRALLGGLGGVALGYGKQQELEQEKERQRVARDLQIAQLGLRLGRSGARPSAAAPSTAMPAPPRTAAAAPSAAAMPSVVTAPAEPKDKLRTPVGAALDVVPEGTAPSEITPTFGGSDIIAGIRSQMMGPGRSSMDEFLSSYSDVRPTFDIGGETYEGLSPRDEAREEYNRMLAQSRLQAEASLQKDLVDKAQAYMTGSVMFPDKFADLPFDPMVDYKEIYDREIQAEKDFATLSQQFGKDASDRLRNVRNDYNNRAVVKDGQTRSTFLKASIQAAEAGLAATTEDAEKAADISLLYSYITSLDPGSVVREGEVLLVNRAASLSDRILLLVQQVNEGGLLTPSMRRSLRADSIERAKEFRQAFQAVNDREAAYLNAQGVDPNLIVFDPYEWVGEYEPDVLDNY